MSWDEGPNVMAEPRSVASAVASSGPSDSVWTIVWSESFDLACAACKLAGMMQLYTREGRRQVHARQIHAKPRRLSCLLAFSSSRQRALSIARVLGRKVVIRIACRLSP